MAKLMLQGEAATVEISQEYDEFDMLRAECVKHGGGPFSGPGIACDWSEAYDSLNDATEYAADHADGGR